MKFRKMANEAPKVLAVVAEYGEFQEILRTLDLLQADLSCSVTIFFAKPYSRRLSADTTMVLGRGYSWIDYLGNLHSQPAPAVHQLDISTVQKKPGPPPRVFKKQRRSRMSAFLLFGPLLLSGATIWILLSLLNSMREIGSGFISLVVNVRYLRKRKKVIEGVVQRIRPHLIIVGQDGVANELSFALQTAKVNGIASMIVPFAMVNLREFAEYASARSDCGVDSGAINWVLSKLFPQWVIEFRGKRVLRLPGARGLALELGGLIKGQPWIPFSEPVEAIACDSEVTKRGLVAMGLPPERISVVGKVVHDCLAQHLKAGAGGRKALLERLRIVDEGPVVCCGWPANIFPWLGGRRIEYSGYPSLARVWARELNRVRELYRATVLISAHPKATEDELAEALAQGFPIVRGDTDELLAHCDVFCTLNGSSITAWAIACNKPVVLFDCYQTGYEEFTGVPGVIMTETEQDFSAELQRLCRSADARQALARAQKSIIADWGTLDGGSGRRLAQLARGLIEQSVQPTECPTQ